MLQSISASQPQPSHFQSVSSQLSCSLPICSLPICSRPVSIDTSSRHRQSVQPASLSQSTSAQPAKFNQLISPSLLAASFTYSQCQLFSVSQPPCSQQLPIQSAIFSQSSPLTASHSRSTLDVAAPDSVPFTMIVSAPPPFAAARAAAAASTPLRARLLHVDATGAAATADTTGRGRPLPRSLQISRSPIRETRGS